MKILLLSQFFSSTRGGGEYVFNLMANSLAENGHNVWVIKNKITGDQNENKKNINIHEVNPELKYRGGLPPSFSDNIKYTLNAISAGQKIIKREKIDLIHSNNFSPALAGSFLSLITSKPHITTVHDIFTLCGKEYWNLWRKQNDVSRLNGRLAPFFEKLNLKLRHDCVHTVSQSTKDDLVKFGEKKPIYVIENSIAKTKPRDDEINPFQFIYVGRLVFYKNLEIIINAIDILREKENQIKLIIVGDGPHRRVLENMINKKNLENNIEFKGHVSNDEKLKLISGSNAMLFPSLCEGFGIVILESFSQNKPVLVSDKRPMSDLIIHGQTGFVLDPYDEKIWAEYILKIIQNPQESKTMGKKGNQILNAKYDQTKFYEKLLKMYNEVLSIN